jgi:hypothetical protein
MDFLLSLCPDIILRLWQNHPFAAGLVTGLAIAYGSGYAFHRWASRAMRRDCEDAHKLASALKSEVTELKIEIDARSARLRQAEAENERLAKELAEQKEKGKGQAGLYAAPMEDIDPYGATAIGKYF